jgi:hypothetical protein
MGALSIKKFIKNLSGSLAEEFALTTSAGAVDADKLPALNAAGILDPTIVNAKTISAGAGDVGKVTQLDATGRLDTSVMPVGIAAESAQIVASELLSAGNWVNIWNNAGVVNVRKADATVAGKEANGFVTAGFAALATATVYFASQTNTQLTTLTPGAVYFLSTTAGAGQTTAPTAAGNIIQTLGRAQSATAITFTPGGTLTLA